MKILALDIGAGTEDVLLFDDAKESVENCIKMVLPSPSLVFAANVREATRLHQDLFINGDIIGGYTSHDSAVNYCQKHDPDNKELSIEHVEIDKLIGGK